MEYSRTFSAVPGNFRKNRKKFLTNPIDILKIHHTSPKLKEVSVFPHYYMEFSLKMHCFESVNHV